MGRKRKWTTDDIPDLEDKTALVTGANSGLGFGVTKALTEKNAHVIMACRNASKADNAKKLILEENPYASLDVMTLDLSDLKSVEKFSDEFKEKYSKLDYLFNNAGVMAISKRISTDGFEMHFATNHLGHFALTGRLLDIITNTPDSRIINTSSLAHLVGRIKFDDINLDKKYNRWLAYGQSKVANLLFTYELHRRLDIIDSSTLSIAAHPGFTATNLQEVGPKMDNAKFRVKMMWLINKIFAQNVKIGILPLLYAAIEPEINGGEFIGPNGFFEMHGYPKKVKSKKITHDEELALKLWELSEKLTGINFVFTL